MTGLTPSGMRAALRRICSSDAARVVLSACIVGGCVALAHVAGLTICPLKRLLGIPCPTCGSTRAAVLLLRGDVWGAFALQPLAAVAACLIFPALAVAWLAFGRRRLSRCIMAVARRPLFWWLCAAAVIANWAYVIANGN